jgi:hypothetical protein
MRQIARKIVGDGNGPTSFPFYNPHFYLVLQQLTLVKWTICAAACHHIAEQLLNSYQLSGGRNADYSNLMYVGPGAVK